MKTFNRLILSCLLFYLAPTAAFAAATNVSTMSISSTPANVSTGYVVGEVVRATVVFSAAETVTVTGGTPSLKLDVGGNIRTATYTSGSGTVNLIFSYTIVPGDVDADGITVVANSLATNGGSITNGGTAATLPHGALVTTNTADKVANSVAALDTTAPVFRSAVASGSTITLTYDEIGSGLKASPLPDTARFAFNRNNGISTQLSINSVTINHTAQTVSLGLSGLINFTDTDLKVSYTANGTNDVQDVAGNTVANLSNVYVANVMPIFDAQGNHFAFNSPTAKVGNGTAVNDKILYDNVINVDGQAIDAIVTTVAKSSGTTILSADGLPTGSTPATTLTGTPTVDDNNWYKLHLNPTGTNGYVKLKFDFIKSGTYSTPEYVILQNVIVNSYDIDNCNNCQYQEFGGFSSYALASNTTLTPTSTADKLTKFTTATSGNVTSGPGTSAGDQIRVMVLYEAISSFEIKVGQPTSSQAFFYIDFSKGPNWNSTYKEYKNPTVNPRITNDTTPYLTGTFVGTVASYTDTVWKLEVIVNGVTYTASTRNDSGNTATITGNGLTGTFDKTTGVGNWYITIPTALPLGTYDVVAMSYFGANLAGATKITADDTTNELVINNVTADETNPTLISFERLNPLTDTITHAGLTIQSYVDFKATFSEAVTNVDRTDFQITGTASTGLSIASAVQSGTTTYTVRISNIPISSLGTLNLDLAAREDIVDLAGNLLTNLIPTGNDETYTIVTSVPAGITVSSISGPTTEAGGTATFTVKLNSQPTANVTIGLHSSDTTEGVVAPSSLTFTPYDWNSPKTVTVTGIDDAIVDGNVGYSIITAAATGDGSGYVGIDAADVAVTNNDNDTAPPPTVTLAVNNANIAEAAGTSTVTATLSAAATVNTTVTIAATGTSTSGSDYTLSSTTITINAGQTTGTATITAVQDAIDDDAETVIVDITGVSGGTGATESSTQQQTVTIVDDDAVGITVTPTSGLITTEAGGTATFDVKLNSQPTADVTINLSSSNTTEGTVFPSSLTFTAGNWNSTQTVTVTGVDDAIVDGNIGYSINLAASGGGYNGINASVSVTNKARPVATNDVETYAPGLPKIVNVLTNDTSDNTIVATSVSIVGGTDANSDGTNEQLIVASEGTWTVNTTTGTITFTPLAIPPNEFFGNPTPISYTVKDTLGMTSNAATVTLTATCSANIGSFSGTVWNDVNYNNTLDAGETPLANVPITLVPQGTTSGPTQIRVTGTDGTFNFAAAPAGAYLLQVQDANLNAARHLYPAAEAASSLYFTSIATCEHKTKNYGYAPTLKPILGDLIWYDVNANGTQDEWFDANDDDQVTKNDPNVLTNMANWEWIDLNGDDSFTGAANEGELNKCGFGQASNPEGNVWVTNTTTNALKKVIVGIQGYWRTRPNYGSYNVALNLTADSGALSNAAQAIAATGKCKTIVNPRSYLLRKGEEKMLSEATLICAPTGGTTGYNVTLADPGTGNPQPELLNIDFGIECHPANQAPVAVDMTNAAPLLSSDGPTTIDALTGTDSDGSVVSITIVTIPAAAQGTLFMADGTTAVTVNQVLTMTAAASLKFDPSGTFVGNSTFTFEVTDNDGSSSANTATATVSIVTPPGITVTPTSGLVTTEALGTAIFTVKLNSQPTAEVTIYLGSSDPTEGTVNPDTLTFTTANWNVTQTVTITGVDDSIPDGNIDYLINIGSGMSDDPNYSRRTYDDISVTNNDDGDLAAGVTVTPVNGLTTTEAGGTASFTVMLTSTPSGTANVEINLRSSDNTEGRVSSTVLNFTASNWDTPQPVTVTGLDDGIIDGDVAYFIETTATSADSNYCGIEVADVAVTNTNDDILPAPGGVAGYLKLWLKANAGISTTNLSGGNQAVSSWVSQSFNPYTARAVSTQTSPLFINNAIDSINFNPVVRFNSNSLVTGIANGTTNGLNLGSNYIYSTNAGMTMFAMLHAHPTQTTAKPVLDFGLAATYGYGFSYGNSQLMLYTPTSAGGVASGNIALTNDTNPVIFTDSIQFNATQTAYLNGENVYSAAITLPNLTAANINEAIIHQATDGPVTIGRRSNTTNSFFAGKIPEIIVYSNVLTDLEFNKVQSYLALKYGITLETNYLASDGSTIRAVHDGYDYDIAGIGRDDDAGLLQLKSKSSNTSSLVTMTIDSFGEDKSFLVWGDNGGSATYSRMGAPADQPSLQIMGKTWKVTTIGNIGTVTITSSDTTAKSLLLDTDGNFTTGATELTLDTGGSIANVPLTNGIYFTLARPIPPGPAVTTGGYNAATITSASVLGEVKPNGTGANTTGISANVKFEYGLTTSYGNTQVATPATITPALETTLITKAAKQLCRCSSGAALTAAIAQIAATFKTPVQANLTNLTCNTQYHYRAVADNSMGSTGTGEDRTFSTAACPPPAIVNVPTAGSIWKRLTTNTIRWSWFTGTRVKIVLYKGGSINKTLASSVTNCGSFNWAIPNSQVLGADYYVRISSISTPTQYADSGIFTIAPEPPPPVVTAPNNAGIIWQRGTNGHINWSNFTGTQVRIYLYKGSSLNRTIATVINAGYFYWNVPTTQAVGTNYKIRVQAVDTGAYDESNSYFSIK